MRKIISIILIIAIPLCFSSCRSSKDATDSYSNLSSENFIASSEETLTTSSETVSETVSDDITTEPSNTVSINSNTNSSITSSSEQQPSAPVEQPAVNSQPTPVVKTKPNFGKLTVYIHNLTKQVSFYSFELTGTIIDYITDEDLIYIVYTNSDIIKLYNSNTGEVVYSHSLPGRPAEMHMYGNELWISFPDLGYIYIYNKADFNLLKSISIGKGVFSFDVYNNYIFYAYEEREQCIYRYDIATQSFERTAASSTRMDGSFFEPAVKVDKNTSTLYIADTNMTACKLYSFNIETMEQRGVFESTPDSGHTTGFANPVRKIILADGYIYWHNFKLAPNVYWKAEQSYRGQFSAPGMLYADKDYVATLGGVYENASGNQILQFKSAPTTTPTPISINKNSKFAITKSKHIMYADGNTLYIFYG